MLNRICSNKSLTLAVWVAIILIGVPAVAFAANLVLDPGEWVGLGPNDGRIVFEKEGNVSDISICDANVTISQSLGVNDNVGIGLSSLPGQRLHLGDGNMLIEGGGETALKIKRDITYTSTVSGVSQNPMFELGRITQAGDGDPEFRFFYTDDHAEERSVLEFDRKGIVASVKRERGSHFEGFIAEGDDEPIFRLNSYPKMRLEMGNGGSTPVDVAIQRETTNTLTILTGNIERVRVDSTGIQVSSGYLKLNTSPGVPPSSDCDNSSEIGRMVVDSTNPVLYICTAQGWSRMTPGCCCLYLPSVHAEQSQEP